VRGGSVSREGVQRDLLPLIEGTTVATKYGPMKTDHVLFIASGRVPCRQAQRHAARIAGPPADPRRIEGAERGGFRAHPFETRANLVEQYTALLGDREGDARIHRRCASREVARIAAQVNESVENIGARRLQTVMEKLLEDLSFEAEDRKGETMTDRRRLCRERLAFGLAKDTDLSKYI
jgi:ATP-dependent HslUV protease ATP-binding subunit HslU